METLLMLLSATMSTEQILETLQGNLNKWLADPSEDNKMLIASTCALYLAHVKCGGSMEGAMEMMKDFKKFDEREKLFNPDKN